MYVRNVGYVCMLCYVCMYVLYLLCVMYLLYVMYACMYVVYMCMYVRMVGSYGMVCMYETSLTNVFDVCSVFFDVRMQFLVFC